MNTTHIHTFLQVIKMSTFRCLNITFITNRNRFAKRRPDNQSEKSGCRILSFDNHLAVPLASAWAAGCVVASLISFLTGPV